MATEESTTPALIDIFFLPFMARGHLIPMVDMARMISTHGVRATILVNPATATSVQPAVDGASRSGHSLLLLLLPGPPEGSCDNPLLLPPEDRVRFSAAVAVAAAAVGAMREPFRRLLRQRRPACVVFDALFPWAVADAREAGVPMALAFNGTSFFATCAADAVHRHLTPRESLSTETVVLPGLPRRVELLRTQLPDMSAPELESVMDNMARSEANSDGMVVNSFYELEPDFVEHYRSALGRRAWHVGPVSLHAERATAEDVSACLSWLDGQEPGSVVYVCFGSWFRLSDAQMGEIAAALQALGRPFIWVGGALADERGSMGLVVRGWAPQRAILGHAALGAFVTHCGWNSCLEAVAAGVPMVTWPLTAEQFYNEKLVAEVLRVGVAVGNRVWALSEKEGTVVTAEEIRSAVEGVMGEGEEAAGVRSRAKELAGMARRATQEGGSSYVDVNRLIDEIYIRATGTTHQRAGNNSIVVEGKGAGHA